MRRKFHFSPMVLGSFYGAVKEEEEADEDTWRRIKELEAFSTRSRTVDRSCCSHLAVSERVSNKK